MIVNRDERRGPATSFAGVADAYERARPGYPDDAVRWLAGEQPCDVVDLGAGTGKLTRSLVAHGHRVVAVEPLEAMRAQLARAVPEATAVAGTAESIPLPDASADVVVCAQAFHWFDHAVAVPEIARVLRPGGRLALVWNCRDQRESWVARLSELIGSEGLGENDYAAILTTDSPFGPVEQASFTLHQQLDRASLRDLVLSRSYCAARPPEEREPVLAAVDVLFDEYAQAGVITLPYVTECFRVALYETRTRITST